ncbi:MAG: alcohol dehydrogenase catalytic domain-containing protein, partial [Gaiella sp.]
MIGLTKIEPGSGHVGLAERDEPQAVPGMVVLEVLGTGICGTDLHIERGEYECRAPVTLGHETCGRVIAVGNGVDGAWIGRRVVTETYFSTCEACPYCLAGRRNLCAERRSIGTHVDGGFAPRLCVPARNLHVVSDEIDDAAATLAEPLACVCNSLLSPPVVEPADAVLVIGPGAIGLLAAQVARLAGGRVVVRGIPGDAVRLALAESLGFATSVVGDRQEPSWLGASRPNVTIECSGSEPGIRYALERTAPAGRIVQIGLRGADVTVPIDLISFRELTVTSGMASTPASWIEAMRLLEHGLVELETLVSGIAGLDDWEQSFARTRRAEGLKFVLDPR